MTMSPWASVVKTVQYGLTGRIRFPRQHIGDVFIDANGQRFIVFREVVIKPGKGQPEKPGAVFIPHFHVAGMSPRANRLFSWLPLWFITGLPGFRSKRWLMDETTGDFSGYYEWDTVAAAQQYADSFAMRFMTRRSRPESVWYHVYPTASAPLPPATSHRTSAQSS
ncbi:MAG TPA: hypothetical protein VHO69_08300 [Phototrophicaceae bacterium]|nr:hypothetical protein [Phototrophicaceae bacterium]